MPRKTAVPGRSTPTSGVPKAKKQDSKMACEASAQSLKKFRDSQTDFQTDCFELLKFHEGNNPDIEWQPSDGIGANAILWREKAGLKLVKSVSFTEHGMVQFPPANTRLCDELVYLATKTLPVEHRARKYPYDFNKRGDINPDRVPSGAAPIIWAHGLPFFPVFKGYYILCGREHAACIGWLINEYDSSVTKNHPRWSIGAVIAPESAARAPHTIDRQMSVHKPFGQDVEICCRGSREFRDVVSADHHHCAVVPHHNRAILLCPLWAFPGYNARCGPPNDYGDATTVTKSFFESKGLGNRYPTLIRPYSNIYSDELKVLAESDDACGSRNFDGHDENVDMEIQSPMDKGHDTVPASPAEVHASETPDNAMVCVEAQESVSIDDDKDTVPSSPAHTQGSPRSNGFMDMAETQDPVPMDLSSDQVHFQPAEPFHADNSTVEMNISTPPINHVAQITESHMEPTANQQVGPLSGQEVQPCLGLSFGLESSPEPALPPRLEPSLRVDLLPEMDPS
ncbi:uncharacterized protein N7511_010269 [Penicillium nucicola]|uniref:uncharacterized protein n=1 Tax=Penicillium nucicola TaxID=1850975 RepID=UPI002545573A|nr:uncharacterized protein N7511_010269 [Penicillium nucicola]KAJ5748573.1 hypothetical protein N7511_010269 [Penicillium nucicola]